jgi:protein involved in polysaccharide export with SLBB domain
MLMLPLVGRQQAAGLTIEQFEMQIAEKLKKYVREPEVVINVLENRSQPVSIFESVAVEIL